MQFIAPLLAFRQEGVYLLYLASRRDMVWVEVQKLLQATFKVSSYDCWRWLFLFYVLPIPVVSAFWVHLSLLRILHLTIATVICHAILPILSIIITYCRTGWFGQIIIFISGRREYCHNDNSFTVGAFLSLSIFEWPSDCQTLLFCFRLCSFTSGQSLYSMMGQFITTVVVGLFSCQAASFVQPYSWYWDDTMGWDRIVAFLSSDCQTLLFCLRLRSFTSTMRQFDALLFCVFFFQKFPQHYLGTWVGAPEPCKASISICKQLLKNYWISVR